MNRRLVLNIAGRALLIEGLLMIPSLFIAFFSREGDFSCLLIACAVAGIAGFLLSRIPVEVSALRARDGFAAVALSWVLLSLFGSLPFTLGGYTSFVDGLFESVSGFTTTGATIFPDVETLPKGLMFWRCFTVWIGGMGILILTLALIPKMGSHAVHLLRAEATGPEPNKLVPRLGGTTRILYLIYVGLSFIMAIVLMALGMSPYDALVHMFSAAGTGGFSNYNASVGHFQSLEIEMAVATFVLLFGVNYSMYFLLIRRNFRAIWKNEELRAYVLVTLFFVLLVAVNAYPLYGSAFTSLRFSYFQVSSIITTAGFKTADYNLWPGLSKFSLMALMLTGACAGSTAGGIKIIRWLILLKSARREVGKLIQPRSVSAIKVQGIALEGEVIQRVMVFFFMYVLLIALGALAVSVDNFDMDTSFSAAVAAIGNVGIGFGSVGPAGNCAGFSAFSKMVLSLLMLVGRLEIFPMLMLISPKSWKHN